MSGPNITATFERELDVPDFPINLAVGDLTEVSWAVGKEFTTFEKHEKSQVRSRRGLPD